MYSGELPGTRTRIGLPAARAASTQAEMSPRSNGECSPSRHRQSSSVVESTSNTTGAGVPTKQPMMVSPDDSRCLKVMRCLQMLSWRRDGAAQSTGSQQTGKETPVNYRDGEPAPSRVDRRRPARRLEAAGDHPSRER